MPEPAVVTPREMTLAEYLAFEETALERHEFHDGEVLAMSGGTFDHARIGMNLNIMLGNRLRGTGCQNLGSDMKVATVETNRFVYPDATIVCGPPIFHEGDPKHTTIINPRVICEVLSPSTEGYDRGDKFNHYRRIDTVDEVLLISQSHRAVQGFLRQGDGTWSLAAWEGTDATARVRCLGIDLPLVELYEFTDDPAAPDPATADDAA